MALWLWLMVGAHPLELQGRGGGPEPQQSLQEGGAPCPHASLSAVGSSLSNA